MRGEWADGRYDRYTGKVPRSSILSTEVERPNIIQDKSLMYLTFVKFSLGIYLQDHISISSNLLTD